MDKIMEGNTMISVNEILKLLDNYRIGKKPLAKLLGWGETTIIRYIDGDIPTSEYSDKLKDILENPHYYYEILLKNQANLTNVAFRKSKKAVLNKMMEKKINIVAQTIINLCEGQISPMEVQILVYYTQGFYLGFYEDDLFQDEYMVQEDRIPYPDLFQEMKGQVLYILEMDEKALSNREKELIKAVVNSFNWYGITLYKLLFDIEKANFKIARDKQNNKMVTKNSLKLLFKDIISDNEIKNLDDIFLYPTNKIKRYIG